MSGFAGIIRLDGAPVDAALVERMTRRTERHGGAAFSVQCVGPAGFGHSLLAALPESNRETQPHSFDGETWIIGDVRVDARKELVADLRAAGHPAELSQPDIELVHLAFHAWGEACVYHLLGDFAFIVWQRRARQVFGARDAFGVKPLYFAALGQQDLVFSNDIDAMRAHPSVSSELNEAAICDYLAFGYNLDEKKSYFAAIDRLPPSHTLNWRAGRAPGLSRYERLVTNRTIRYTSEDAYRQHFLEVFGAAVRDRLRGDRIGFELSGGLDSSSVAAMAARLNRDNPRFSGVGITTDNSATDPNDREAEFAARVCRHAGLRHVVMESVEPGDFYAYCETAQPFTSPFMASTVRYAARMRAGANTMFSGQGGDVFFDGSGYDLLDEFRELPLSTFLRTLAGRVWRRKSIRGLGLRSLRAGDAPRMYRQPLSPWLRKDFIEQAGTIERWNDLYARPGRYPPGCLADMAWDQAHMPVWTHLFEDYYHEFFGGIDCRHPYFDLRLANDLLAMPMSQKKDKGLVRVALQGLLPDAVLNRPKSVIVFDSLRVRLAGEFAGGMPDPSLEPLARWIDTKRYAESLDRYVEGGPGDRYTSVYPLNLVHWLQCKM